MSTGRNGEQSSSGPTVLADIGIVGARAATNRKGGSHIEVRVCENASTGHPAIDVRRFITSTPNDREGYAGKGKDRTQYKRSAYVGPTREGFWLDPGEAEELLELLAAAVLDAGEREIALEGSEVA